MLIRVLALIHDYLSQDIVSLLEVLSSRERQRKRTQFPDLLLKQNIELLSQPHVNYNGLLTCSNGELIKIAFI